jgi:hypothetical protein
MRSAALLALALVGCHEDAPKQQAEQAAKPSACPEGWHASQTQLNARAGIVITIGCDHGTPNVTFTTQDLPDGRPSSHSHPISKADWVGLWDVLEAAHWRDLTPKCADEIPLPPGLEALRVMVSISDGQTSRWYECEVQNMTLQHDEILKAFEQAVAFAGRRE